MDLAAYALALRYAGELLCVRRRNQKTKRYCWVLSCGRGSIPSTGLAPSDDQINWRRIASDKTTNAELRGILKKCVNSQAVYPLSEQHGLKARERRYTAHEEGKHWE